jgi:hypothetical protein
MKVRFSKMSDDELREWCITNYGTPEVSECEKCPNQKECDDFMERHNFNTPLFG